MGDPVDVVPGEPIEAVWGNQIRDQSISRWVDGTARDVGIPLPEPGKVVWLDNPGVLEGYDGSAWVTLDRLIGGGGPFLPLAGGTMGGTISSTVDGSPVIAGGNGGLFFEPSNARIWLSGVDGESIYFGPRTGGQQFGLLEAQANTVRIPNGGLSVQTPGPPAGRWLEASNAWTILRDPGGRMLSSVNPGTAWTVQDDPDGDPGGGPTVQKLSMYYRNGAGNISAELLRMTRQSAAFHLKIGSLPTTQTEERAVWVIGTELSGATGTLYRLSLANLDAMDAGAEVAYNAATDEAVQAVLTVPPRRMPWATGGDPELHVLPEDMGAFPSVVRTNAIGESYVSERQLIAGLVGAVQHLLARVEALEGP